MIRVLFVCLGNICRSPMAEAIFRDMVKKEGLQDEVKVDSAGTGDWHVGNPPHQGTREILNKYEISSEGLAARQITGKDLNEFDYIIGMDESNMNNIKKLGEISSHITIKRLLDFVDLYEHKDVPDPYYTGNFEEVYGLVKDGCAQLLQEIKEKIRKEGNNG